MHLPRELRLCWLIWHPPPGNVETPNRAAESGGLCSCSPCSASSALQSQCATRGRHPPRSGPFACSVGEDTPKPGCAGHSQPHCHPFISRTPHPSSLDPAGHPEGLRSHMISPGPETWRGLGSHWTTAWGLWQPGDVSLSMASQAGDIQRCRVLRKFAPLSSRTPVFTSAPPGQRNWLLKELCQQMEPILGTVTKENL